MGKITPRWSPFHNERFGVRFFAVLAIAWASGWLLLIGVPTGQVGAVDRGYGLMFLPFQLSADASLLVRRLVEFVCLLPAAAFLAMAQMAHKRRIERATSSRQP